MDKPAKVVEARDGESLEEVGERFKRWRETRGRGEGASAGSGIGGVKASAGSKASAGRVEDRFSPALPHQTVHAVFPHTAFRCSSRQGMRRVPARFRRDFVQPVARVEMSTWKPAGANSTVLHLVTRHQVSPQPVFRVGSDFVHRLT